MGGRDRLIHSLPLAGGGWTAQRDLPAAHGRTFRELYAARSREHRV
jgi:L-lactate dehydrogenase complex protein LldF